MQIKNIEIKTRGVYFLQYCGPNNVGNFCEATITLFFQPSMNNPNDGIVFVEFIDGIKPLDEVKFRKIIANHKEESFGIGEEYDLDSDIYRIKENELVFTLNDNYFRMLLYEGVIYKDEIILNMYGRLLNVMLGGYEKQIIIKNGHFKYIEL